MLLIEKNEIVLKVLHQNNELTVRLFQSEPDREKYGQAVANSEEAIALNYQKAWNKFVSTKNVIEHFISRGWKLQENKIPQPDSTT
jgi:hypothetical protein